MINLNYLTDYILYQILIIILSIRTERADNLSMRIYVNKIENRITFKIKTGYYLEFLTLQNNEFTWKH